MMSALMSVCVKGVHHVQSRASKRRRCEHVALNTRRGVYRQGWHWPRCGGPKSSNETPSLWEYAQPLSLAVIKPPKWVTLRRRCAEGRTPVQGQVKCLSLRLLWAPLDERQVFLTLPPLPLFAKTATAGEPEGNHSWLPGLGLRRKRERLLTWAAAMGSMSRVVRGNTRKCIAVFVAVACGERNTFVSQRNPLLPVTTAFRRACSRALLRFRCSC